MSCSPPSKKSKSSLPALLGTSVASEQRSPLAPTERAQRAATAITLRKALCCLGEEFVGFTGGVQYIHKYIL